MNVIKTTVCSIFFCIGLSGCSTTTSDVHQVMASIDRSAIQGVSLAIETIKVQRTSQTSGHIFTLHHTAEEIKHIAQLVAQRYGFSVVKNVDNSINEESSHHKNTNEMPEDSHVKAGYYINVLNAMPDGGACLEGLAATAKNISYTSSVLTFGVAPASVEHCLIVTAELYQYQDGQPVSIGLFSSDLGRVAVYAGVNEIDNYQLSVDKKDEIRSLEVSIGGLLNKMLLENAFEQKQVDEYSF